MIDEKPITLDDIIKMDDPKDDLSLLPPDHAPLRPPVGNVKNTLPVKKQPDDNGSNQTVLADADFKPNTVGKKIPPKN